MQELCSRELVSSHKTVLVGTGEGADREINTKLEADNIHIPQELSPSSQSLPNPHESIHACQTPQKMHQSPDSKINL